MTRSFDCITVKLNKLTGLYIKYAKQIPPQSVHIPLFQTQNRLVLDTSELIVVSELMYYNVFFLKWIFLTYTSKLLTRQR